MEVINGGTTGYGIDQEYLFFLQVGARYDPDVVVLLFYYNDLTDDTVAGLDKPRFELRGGELMLRNSPVPPPAPTVAARLAQPYKLKPFRGSIALRLLSSRAEASNPKLHEWLVGLGLAEASRPAQAIPDEFWPFRPPRQLGREPWRKPAAILAALQAAVEGKGARLLVLYVPVRFELDDSVWDETRERHGLGERWTRDGAIDWLRRACHALGIPLIDLRGALREQQAVGRGAYFPSDGHWNENGHDLAAREIARRLRTTRWLD